MSGFALQDPRHGGLLQTKIIDSLEQSRRRGTGKFGRQDTERLESQPQLIQRVA